mgnify:CR=1 FL=1
MVDSNNDSFMVIPYHMATVVSIPLWNRGKNELTILITFVIIKFMKAQIVSELTEFIRLTGCSVRRLCLEAGGFSCYGVSCAYWAEARYALE